MSSRATSASPPDPLESMRRYARRLQDRLSETEERLREAEETLEALRTGEVDAVIVEGAEGERVYTLKGADETYRLFLQDMAEGAVTLTLDGVIAFCNEPFASMLGVPLERVIGARIQDFTDRENALVLSALLDRALDGSRKHELSFITPSGDSVPVYMSVNRLRQEGVDCVCAIVTNLTEHKRNEEIVEAEKLARSILQQAAETILVVDPSGQVIRASSAADSLAGTRALLSRFDTLFRIRLEETGDPYGFEQILAAVKDHRVIKGLAATARTYNRKTVEVLLSAAPLTGTSGQLLGCVITLTDVSELRNASRLLEQSGKRFRRLMESNIVGIFVVRGDQVTDANRTFLGLLGYSPEDIASGQFDWRKATPDEFCGLDDECLRILRETGACPPFEKEYIRRDGARIPVLMGAAMLSSEPQLEWISFVVDIAERKQAERVLRDSEHRLRMAGELSGFSAYEWDPATGALNWDARLKAMWGLNADDPVDYNVFLSAVHSEDRPMVEERVAACLDPAGDGIYIAEFRVIGIRDGVERWILARGQTSFTNGRPTGFIGGALDITARKRIERELRYANADLEQFAYSASHDLQEPLRAVCIYSELLTKRYADRLDGQSLEFLEFLRNGASRMAALVHDLLAYTQASSMDSPVEETDANQAVEVTLLNLKKAISESHAQVEAGPLPAVKVHKIHLQQLFQNLVGNALKYRGKDAPRVRISAEIRDGQWLFSVADNGIGIAPEYREKIFGLFKRLHSGHEYAGTGIGLAICQRIVERYRGRIWVASNPGQGSTFYFTLPK